MRRIRWSKRQQRYLLDARRGVFLGLLVLLAIAAAVPASAQITSVSPGSANVLPGNSVGVNVTTDGTLVGVSGNHAGISVGPSQGSGPTVRFTFTAGTSAAPGSYGYSFFDDLGGSGSFTLIVVSK